MPRYVDVDALPMWDELFMKGKNDSGVWVRYRDVENMLKNAPTADVEEVMHREWKEWHNIYFCERCECASLTITNYCPNCGAKMDGKKGE